MCAEVVDEHRQISAQCALQSPFMTAAGCVSKYSELPTSAAYLAIDVFVAFRVSKMSKKIKKINPRASNAQT